MAERLTRDAVVARAADLADEIGLGEVTITKLGRALGIAPPGVYRHVTDLADLRRAIGVHAAREGTGVLSAATAGLSGKDALAVLGSTLRSWAREHPGRYAALQIAPDLDDVRGQQAAADLLSVFAAVLRAYALTGDDLTDAIRIIRATLHGFAMLELGEGFKAPRDIEITYARVIESLDTVFSGWST
jgi:AcrR family transcriptional regulator